MPVLPILAKPMVLSTSFWKLATPLRIPSDVVLTAMATERMTEDMAMVAMKGAMPISLTRIALIKPHTSAAAMASRTTPYQGQCHQSMPTAMITPVRAPTMDSERSTLPETSRNAAPIARKPGQVRSDRIARKVLRVKNFAPRRLAMIVKKMTSATSSRNSVNAFERSILLPNGVPVDIFISFTKLLF